MQQPQIAKIIEEYKDHLKSTASTFNSAAEKNDLPIRMDPTKAIKTIDMGIGLAEIVHYWSLHDEFGIVHDTQTRTVVDCIVKIMNDSTQRGHIVGAMQSGKTTTSLALQWVGPIMYLLKGLQIYPFYIIGSQTGHEDQTNTELERFFTYYGNIEFVATPEISTFLDTIPLSLFARAPNLSNYRRHVLAGAEKDILDVPKLEDLVHRRVGGNQSLTRIVERSKRATDHGYSPLMIIDEPQYGASDPEPTGGGIQRKCVLAQIFDSIEEALGTTRESHWFIGLSATPFELNDLNRLWEVRQYLTPEYSGFNYFNGEPICAGVDIKPPETLSLSTFAEQIKVPFLAKVVMSAYDKNKPTAFQRHAGKIRYEKTQDEYRKETESALRTTIYALLNKHKNTDEPVGLCIRALNNNTKTDALIQALALDTNKIEVIEYYGSEMTRKSVKRAVAQRKNPKLPYVIFVTNRARMADAFPTQVLFFMDFGIKASDLNSLLQGLLGRACGYKKKSTVVLSDASASIVEAYVATNGGYVHKTSRHSVTVGGFRRGAPTGMLKIYVNQDDDIVKKYFQRINTEVVEPNVSEGFKLNPKRSKNNTARRGPILLIAEELGLFDHIEHPAIRGKIFPDIPTGFKVARRDDIVYHTRQKDTPLSYSTDENGNCRYTFRWQREAQGGAQGRAKGLRDSKDGQHMEPTIYIEKYNPETGEVINDKEAKEQVAGKWRAFMITFPLREPVREIRAATIALPVENSPYSAYMTDDERDLLNGKAQ